MRFIKSCVEINPVLWLFSKRRIFSNIEAVIDSLHFNRKSFISFAFEVNVSLIIEGLCLRREEEG
jgi:hypothetical protein